MGTRTKLKNTVSIVVAAACLHNFIQCQNEPPLEDEGLAQELEDAEIDHDAPRRAENAAGARIAGTQFRDWIVANFCV